MVSKTNVHIQPQFRHTEIFIHCAFLDVNVENKKYILVFYLIYEYVFMHVSESLQVCTCTCLWSMSLILVIA